MKEETFREDQGISFVRPSSGKSKDADQVWLRCILYLRFYFAILSAQLLRFVLPVILIDMYSDSLAPGAISAISAYSVCLVVLPAVQDWMNRANRLSTGLFTVLFQTGLSVGCLGCLAMVVLEIGDAEIVFGLFCVMFSGQEVMSRVNGVQEWAQVVASK